MRCRLALPFAILVVLGATTACGGDDTGGNNNGGGGLAASTNYVGLYATSSGATGALNIQFASAVATPSLDRGSPGGPTAEGRAPIEATGTVTVGGTSIPITGSLDQGALSMTGAGGLAIAGTLADGVITGTFSVGDESGSITLASSATGTPARAYCGTFEGTVSGSEEVDAGTFSAVIAGTVVSGIAVGDGGTVNSFKGVAVPSANGGSFTIHQTVAEGKLDVTDGIYTAESTSGHYATSVGGTPAASGAFSGQANCPAPQ
jgi:hypothetical protein